MFDSVDKEALFAHSTLKTSGLMGTFFFASWFVSICSRLRANEVTHWSSAWGLICHSFVDWDELKCGASVSCDCGGGHVGSFSHSALKLFWINEILQKSPATVLRPDRSNGTTDFRETTRPAGSSGSPSGLIFQNTERGKCAETMRPRPSRLQTWSSWQRRRERLLCSSFLPVHLHLATSLLLSSIGNNLIQHTNLWHMWQKLIQVY